MTRWRRARAAAITLAARASSWFEHGMWRTLLVGAGGFIGAIARYLASGLMQNLTSISFPFGTLIVNVLGSFLIGVVTEMALARGLIGPDARIFLTVGVLGGFTTMSSFSFETLALLREGALSFAIGNVLATLVLCLSAVWAGVVVVRAV